MKAWPLLVLLYASRSHGFSSTTPTQLDQSWKEFYEAAELRYVQLQSDSQEHIQKLQAQVDDSTTQRDLAIEMAKLAETNAQQLSKDARTSATYHETCRQQFLSDIRDLQDERDRLELRWAEECERSRVALQQSQRQHSKELLKVRETAQATLNESIANYEGKLNDAKQRMMQLDVVIANQQRDIDQAAIHIQRLEKERQSFRSLFGLSVQLLHRRLRNVVRWVLRSDDTTHPTRRSRRRGSMEEPLMMEDEHALLMAARRYTNGGML